MPNTGNLKETAVPATERPAGRETISAVIMTMNAEAIVEGTLKSVAGWVDEIVVLDGFSTDRTVEICRRYTDNVRQNLWDKKAYSTERNLGTSFATKDWCLHIDPDERATPQFRDAVLAMLARGTTFDAFEFRKKNYFMGKWMRHGGWYHYSLHLFRRGRARYEGVVHESLKVQGAIGKIEAPVEHHPFTTFSQFLKRHNWYSQLEAREEYEKHGLLPERVLAYELRTKPLKLFFKFYVRKKGFLDGIHGLIFSVLYAWVHFINWAKYWELVEKKDGRA